MVRSVIASVTTPFSLVRFEIYAVFLEFLIGQLVPGWDRASCGLDEFRCTITISLEA